MPGNMDISWTILTLKSTVAPPLTLYVTTFEWRSWRESRTSYPDTGPPPMPANNKRQGNSIAPTKKGADATTRIHNRLGRQALATPKAMITPQKTFNETNSFWLGSSSRRGKSSHAPPIIPARRPMKPICLILDSRLFRSSNHFVGLTTESTRFGVPPPARRDDVARSSAPRRPAPTDRGRGRWSPDRRPRWRSARRPAVQPPPPRR